MSQQVLLLTVVSRCLCSFRQSPFLRCCVSCASICKVDWLQSEYVLLLVADWWRRRHLHVGDAAAWWDRWAADGDWTSREIGRHTWHRGCQTAAEQSTAAAAGEEQDQVCAALFTCIWWCDWLSGASRPLMTSPGLGLAKMVLLITPSFNLYVLLLAHANVTMVVAVCLLLKFHVYVSDDVSSQ